MKVNLVELTDGTKRKTKNELLKEFAHFANLLMDGNDYFKQNRFYKLRNAKAISFVYQHEVLSLQRTRLLGEYMFCNGFNDEDVERVTAHLDHIHGNERFSSRTRKGFVGELRSLKKGLAYVDEYKYAHMDWNQSPILRASLPCE
jgi:hypothetical protein